MKICYLADASSIHVQRWVKYFAERGHDVHLISYNPADINGIQIYVLPKKKNPYLTFILRFVEIKRLIKKIKPDLLHTHYIGGYGWYGALSGFHPFVVSAWGSDVLADPKRSRVSKLLTKFVLKKADLIACDGNNLRKALIELGAEPQKIYRICWGTDTQKFNPEQRSEKIREDLGISNSPTIISSKPLELGYDIESLIKSIPLVLKEVPEAKFVIAGRGSQETVLKQLAKSLGVSDSVGFVGWIPSDEFPQYLASADIYVCTSLSDGGLAIATKEAMACELPVVITDLKVNTEWIKNGENGFIVPLKDPKSLAEKIIYLVEHEDIRMEFGEKGRKMVTGKFEYDKELKKVENIYKRLINK